ncbi:hypothetical protein B0O99DRAFT_255483 [Bisporella sp. PMI_857]|nr:hypothetical protein B0O99DRAFT_255483 [Bisporella sp. PMI_857]
MDATDPFLENNGNPQSLNSQEGKFTLPPLRRSLLALGVEGLVESRVDKYEASIDTPFNTPTPSGSSWSTMGPLRSDLSMRGKSSTKLGRIIEEGEAPSLGMNSPAVGKYSQALDLHSPSLNIDSVPLNLRPASLSLRPAPLKLGDDKEEAKQPVKTDFYGGDDKAEGSPALSELIDNQSEEDEPMRINFYPGTGVETIVVDAARKVSQSSVLECPKICQHDGSPYSS